MFCAIFVTEKGIVYNIVCGDVSTWTLFGTNWEVHMSKLWKCSNFKFYEKTILIGTNINFEKWQYSWLFNTAWKRKKKIYSCRYEQIKPRLWADSKTEIETTAFDFKKEFLKKVKNWNVYPELNLPVFSLEWAFYKPVIMLE